MLGSVNYSTNLSQAFRTIFLFVLLYTVLSYANNAEIIFRFLIFVRFHLTWLL